MKTIGALLAIGCTLLTACGDSEGEGAGGSGGAATSSSSSTGSTSTTTGTGPGTGGSGSSTTGQGGVGGSGQGGAGPLVCGDGLVVPGERCGVALGVSGTRDVGNLVIADVDEDGDGDVVTALELIRNEGGRFVPESLGDFEGNRVAVGHLDDDGHLNLVVPTLDDVLVRYGNGDGTFEAPLVLPLEPEAGFHAAIGDISGDGVADFAVVTLDAAVVFYIADGEGGFVDEVHPLGSDVLMEVQIADLDGDGLNEVMVIEESAFVDVWNGSEWASYPSIGDFHQFAVVDLDDDGALDLVGAGWGSQTVEILPGDGEAGFGAPVVIDLPWHSRAIATGDFDGDGIRDIALGSLGDEPETAPRQIAFLYGEDGGFEPVIVQDAVCDVWYLATGDVNEDGLPDLAGPCDDESTSAGPTTGAGGGGPPVPPTLQLWLSEP